LICWNWFGHNFLIISLSWLTSLSSDISNVKISLNSSPEIMQLRLKILLLTSSGSYLAFLNTRPIVRKTRSHIYIICWKHVARYIHTLFCVIFSGKVFCKKLTELLHTFTCLEKDKEIRIVISIVVWCQELHESTCKRNLLTFSHRDLPERHIIGLTPGDLEIASPSAFYNICICRHYLLIEKVLCCD
jgi:hypothetical protein